MLFPSMLEKGIPSNSCQNSSSRMNCSFDSFTAPIISGNTEKKSGTPKSENFSPRLNRMIEQENFSKSLWEKYVEFKRNSCNTWIITYTPISNYHELCVHVHRFSKGFFKLIDFPNVSKNFIPFLLQDKKMPVSEIKRNIEQFSGISPSCMKVYVGNKQIPDSSNLYDMANWTGNSESVTIVFSPSSKV